MGSKPTTETNEAERRRWNDERWIAVWPKRERLSDAITAFLLDAAALRPGERVLDVGCGGGKSSLAAVRPSVAKEPSSAPTSRRLSSRSLRGAAASAAVDNAEFYVVDMQNDLIEGRPFDVALSQFGVMFFDEPVTAFSNIRAHLKPDGRIVFACWQSEDKNPWIFSAAIREFVPPPPLLPAGKSATGPFALADPDQTAAILHSAGFRDVRRTLTRSPSMRHAMQSSTTSSSSSWAYPSDKLAAAQAGVAEHMQQFVLDASLSRFPLAFQIFEARSS